MSCQAQEQIKNLSVEDRWNFKVLPGRSGPGQNEDAGTNDGADAQRREAPRPKALFKPMVGLFRLGDQLVDGLSGEVLVCQSGDLLMGVRKLPPYPRKIHSGKVGHPRVRY